MKIRTNLEITLKTKSIAFKTGDLWMSINGATPTLVTNLYRVLQVEKKNDNC